MMWAKKSLTFDELYTTAEIQKIFKERCVITFSKAVAQGLIKQRCFRRGPRGYFFQSLEISDIYHNIYQS